MDTSRVKSEASAHTRSQYTPLQWETESCVSHAMEAATSSPPHPGYLQERRLERKLGTAPDTSTHRCRSSRCSSLSPSVSNRDGNSFYCDNGKGRHKSAPIRCLRCFLRERCVLHAVRALLQREGCLGMGGVDSVITPSYSMQ